MSYASQIDAARSMIARKGANATWHVNTSTPDPSQPWNELSGVSQDYSVSIVLLPFDSFTRRMFGYSEGYAVPVGTVAGYMAGGYDFSPALRDTVSVEGHTYVVRAIDKINPDAAADILYVLELRQ